MENQTAKQAAHLVAINPAFGLLPEEIAFLSGLPEFSPNANYSTSDKRRIEGIYYRVFTTSELGTKLQEIDAKEKWTTGEKLRVIESKLIILKNLVNLNRFTGLHETLCISDVFNALLTGRQSYLYMLPRVTILAEIKGPETTEG